MKIESKIIQSEPFESTEVTVGVLDVRWLNVLIEWGEDRPKMNRGRKMRRMKAAKNKERSLKSKTRYVDERIGNNSPRPFHLKIEVETKNSTEGSAMTSTCVSFYSSFHIVGMPNFFTGRPALFLLYGIFYTLG